MKISGWILTVLGGMLCFGALIMASNGEKVLVVPVIFSIIVLVIGLVILNYKKK